MKVSLITTLKNEESSLKEFLDSLLAQSRPPDEIIMVDGGSSDKTVEIIDSYIKNGAPIKLIVSKGANIAQGRNIAIKNSKYDVIASTDLGCRLNKDWLKNLLDKFGKQTDIVSGCYLNEARTTFEKVVTDLASTNLDILTAEDFLPSNRSIAFKKSVWQELGGFPEHIKRSDDTLFDLEARRRGKKFEIAKDAIVYRRCRKNLKELIRTIFLDVESDIIGKVRPLRHFRFYLFQIFTVMIMLLLAIVYKSVLILIMIILLGLLYYLISFGCFVYRRRIRLNFTLPLRFVVLVSSHLSMVLGITSGMFKKLLLCNRLKGRKTK